MPETPSEPNKPPDVRTIHQLVRLMKTYDLTAIDFMEGGTKIRLRRRGAGEGLASPVSSAPSASPPPATPTPPVPSPTTSSAPSNEVVIESPMVGTYYASSSPDAPPFVNVGSVVRPETTVCVIEAMKVFTDIPAQLSGVVTEVLVKNGQPVEFGQPMFRVRPS
ncbi:MAG: acetyl-CoA carboxylase biotin carboxyl carrier protein [Isosphaeraceae bacterium]